MKSETIQVRGMSCAHCTMAIEKAVAALPGVGTVSADFRSNVVQVRFDESKTGLEQIRTAIEGAGYEVTRS